jgi:hypothetical protein
MIRNPLITEGLKMDCECSVRHSHPLCRTRRFSLFRWWHDKHGKNPGLTAITLGVSRRTVHRWLSDRDVPLHVATLLDQIRSGPVLRFGFWRAGAWALRPEWRDTAIGEIARIERERRACLPIVVQRDRRPAAAFEASRQKAAQLDA